MTNKFLDKVFSPELQFSSVNILTFTWERLFFVVAKFTVDLYYNCSIRNYMREYAYILDQFSVTFHGQTQGFLGFWFDFYSKQYVPIICSGVLYHTTTWVWKSWLQGVQKCAYSVCNLLQYTFLEQWNIFGFVNFAKKLTV